MPKVNHLDHNIKLEGKRVLIRTDFNVPLNNGYITEASRIEKVLPTIKFLINSKAKIIIISHIGRPKGKNVPSLSLKPIAKKLIDATNACGWHCAKFQKRNPDVCVPENQKSKIRNTPWGEMTYLEYKYKVEFEKEDYDIINQ